MKKALILLVLIGFAIHAEATKITVYGCAKGSETTSVTDGGTTTTTTTIDCDPSYPEICYTVETGLVGGDILTIGNDPTPVVRGQLVSNNQSTYVVVFVVE